METRPENVENIYVQTVVTETNSGSQHLNTNHMYSVWFTHTAKNLMRKVHLFFNLIFQSLKHPKCNKKKTWF